MPLYSDPLINNRLIDHVTDYLQSLDSSYFPFTENFDDEKRAAFVRDLRIGLSDLVETGSKRGTSATGFLTSDKRLHAVIAEWAAAEGGWPKGHDPKNPDGVTPMLPTTR